MSEGERIPRLPALHMAEVICHVVEPACERIAIAGSLRRNKPDVGDIEIVCIPKAQADLFGGTFRSSGEIRASMIAAGYIFLKGGEHLQQYETPEISGFHAELYITTPEQWGVIYTIRTGCADYSHRLVTPRSMGGMLPSYLRVKEGRVWNGSHALETPEEADFYRLTGIPWLQPEARNL